VRRTWAGSRLLNDAVFNELRSRARDGVVTITMREIADLYGCSRATICRVIHDLIDDGVIDRIQCGGRWVPASTYRVTA
jgi:DNA-binding GntR family transcriptional regulator